MAWIELHQTLWTHKKTVLLASELNVDELYAGAHMAHLWCWALDNVSDGDLSGLPSRVIAFGASWKGDPDIFLEALIKSKWVDRTEDRLLLHDWHDYAGRLIEKRNANAERMREARATTNSKRATNVQNTNNARAGATKPNQTVPNQTEPNGGDNAHAQEYLQECVDAIEGKMQIKMVKADYIIANKDHAEVIRLLENGVPLDFILLGIDQVFESFEPKTSRDKINSFRYCSPAIERAWELELQKQEERQGLIHGSNQRQRAAPGRADPPSASDWLKQQVAARDGT